MGFGRLRIGSDGNDGGIGGCKRRFIARPDLYLGMRLALVAFDQHQIGRLRIRSLTTMR